jgi:hypothetical protein
LAGCSKEPSLRPVPAPPDKIHGKAQILFNESMGSDAALNAGGPSVYLVMQRLFFHMNAIQKHSGSGDHRKTKRKPMARVSLKAVAHRAVLVAALTGRQRTNLFADIDCMPESPPAHWHLKDTSGST